MSDMRTDAELVANTMRSLHYIDSDNCEVQETAAIVALTELASRLTAANATIERLTRERDWLAAKWSGASCRVNCPHYAATRSCNGCNRESKESAIAAAHDAAQKAMVTP